MQLQNGDAGRVLEADRTHRRRQLRHPWGLVLLSATPAETDFARALVGNCSTTGEDSAADDRLLRPSSGLLRRNSHGRHAGLPAARVSTRAGHIDPRPRDGQGPWGSRSARALREVVHRSLPGQRKQGPARFTSLPEKSLRGAEQGPTGTGRDSDPFGPWASVPGVCAGQRVSHPLNRDCRD